MKRILVVADPYGSEQRTVVRAARLAAQMSARLEVVGFVYEHLANLPVEMALGSVEDVKAELIARHSKSIEKALEGAGKHSGHGVQVHWEKRVAERVNMLVAECEYDLVIKGGHRSETLTYTPTDWLLLRTCRVPVLLLSAKQWKKSTNVMAAVDLGTKVRSKLALNFKIVEHAAALAAALDSKLHISYVAPFSKVLRDLGLLSKHQLRREGERRAEKFRASLEERGIAVEAIHVAIGAPEKALISLAAENKAGLVVLGTVGRKKLVGRVLGNTAEQILRLLKADVLAIKP
jgi:universal stress protein E